ncbi:MAG TPA: fumarylacetoacetate hydrolase family protein [Paraburkholderia sp.]|uniref:fumarylacetoacetate hydrolase family protein n=1 Tax=Paraburkholderia sp. TaxID=1926495 RepID=UPI002B497154|nr:fumarylacetoacetate hydrolase family protein [Paraburkholderia sp.]HKR42899.1 fumarylacetoacetate hydrolase family protein [Paraburkholderia sp.]
MKLLRYGLAGAELPGALDSEGRIRALRPIVRDIDQDVLSPEGRRFLSAVDVTQLPIVPGTPRLGPPVKSVREIIAIGLNYRDHALEAALPIPDEPVVFGKSTSSISGPYDDIVLAPGSTRTDWEIELGIVMGSVASRVGPDEAMASVAGYCMVNDVSERQWQLHRNGQWGKGKSFDSYTPIGPWLVTPDEIANPQGLELRLSVNGQQRQLGHTEDMIFGVANVVSYCSQFMTLQPGDLIITGTPAGVGLGMKPPAYLAAGDVITMGITGLGLQRHVVREAPQV